MPIQPGEEGAIRELLVKLGVDIEFWTKHADRIEQDEAFVREHAPKFNPDLDEGRVLLKRAVGLMDCEDDASEVTEEKKRTRAQVASIADDMAIALEDSIDEEFSELLKDAIDDSGERGIGLKDVRGFPGPLVLIGDSLAILGRVDAAKDVYSLAVDLAKTPQSQLEIGYLLASRGSLKSPGNWGYGEQGECPAILLLPDRWMGHSGLPYFEVVYEELLPGPALPDSSPVLQLALEAYGRVFGYCYPANESGAADWSHETPARPLEPYVVDGLHALLARLDVYDLNLVYACLHTAFEIPGNAPIHVVDRLRLSESYLHGFEEGREGVQTSEEADQSYKKEVGEDSATQAELVADVIEDRRLARRHRERNEIAQDFRDYFDTKWWQECPEKVRQDLIEAESEFVTRQADRSDDFSEAALKYGKTAESHLLWITGLTNKSLGEFLDGQCRSRLVAKLKQSAPLGTLWHRIRQLAPLRRPGAHGSAERRPVPAGRALRARSRTLDILEILLKQRRQPGASRPRGEGGNTPG